MAPTYINRNAVGIVAPPVKPQKLKFVGCLSLCAKPLQPWTYSHSQKIWWKHHGPGPLCQLCFPCRTIAEQRSPTLLLRGNSLAWAYLDGLGWYQIFRQMAPGPQHITCSSSPSTCATVRQCYGGAPGTSSWWHHAIMMTQGVQPHERQDGIWWAEGLCWPPSSQLSCGAGQVPSPHNRGTHNPLKSHFVAPVSFLNWNYSRATCETTFWKSEPDSIDVSCSWHIGATLALWKQNNSPAMCCVGLLWTTTMSNLSGPGLLISPNWIIHHSCIFFFFFLNFV